MNYTASFVWGPSMSWEVRLTLFAHLKRYHSAERKHPCACKQSESKLVRYAMPLRSYDHKKAKFVLPTREWPIRGTPSPKPNHQRMVWKRRDGLPWPMSTGYVLRQLFFCLNSRANNELMWCLTSGLNVQQEIEAVCLLKKGAGRM